MLALKPMRLHATIKNYLTLRGGMSADEYELPSQKEFTLETTHLSRIPFAAVPFLATRRPWWQTRLPEMVQQQAIGPS